MKPVLCWIDLETTGLDPECDRILQAAIALTDTELRPIAEPFEVVINRSQAVLDLLNPFVREMHTRTGLLKRVEESVVRAEQAYSDMFSYVRNHTDAGARRILAGSSIHFDRSFLKRQVPRLEEMFYHRHLDVSALKHLSEWWGYPLFRASGTAHLATDDIRNSIEELKHYRSSMLREV